MSIREKCGVMAIQGIDGAASYCALGLHALQHRGQEGAGVSVFADEKLSATYIDGQINTGLNQFESLNGDMAIGHVRYSTSGKKCQQSLKQPICANLSLGEIALAHNGNLVNADILKKKLMNIGCIFQSDVDTEVLIHLIAVSKKNTFIDRIIDAISQVKGAYSLVLMTKDMIVGVRDPMGIRPLVLGRMGEAYSLASESCAFDIINAQFIRDIAPGEMLIIHKEHGMETMYPFEKESTRSCIFEYIYFARPDSIVDGLSVYEVRHAIGREMAKENSQEQADVVVPIPDSGVPAAIGYAQESGIPFEFGIIRNHYIGRTFIEPIEIVRQLGVKLKHNANKHVIYGKKVILVDDSIVRGNTSKKIVSLVRDAGAKEVHMRIASLPMTHPCFYGVDTPSKDKLISANKSIEEIKELIGVDSLKFISKEGLYNAVKNNRNYCDACFTGNYPIKISDDNNA